MIKYWDCPNCTEMACTVDNATPMHQCQKLGLTVPLIVSGTKAKLVVVEREDYVGSELVQYDPVNHRPVMAVNTIRDDGQDCTVYPPTAIGTAEGVCD